MNKKLALKMAVFLFALVNSYRRSDPFHPMVRIAITVLDMVVDMCLAKDRSNILGVCVSPCLQTGGTIATTRLMYNGNMKNMLGGSHLSVKKAIQGQSCPRQFVFGPEYRLFVDTKVHFSKRSYW